MFEEFERMQQQMERLFNEFAPMRALVSREDNKLVRKPVCDVNETDNKLIVSFELPGAKKGDIDVNVTDDYVEVRVENEAESSNESDSGKSYSFAKHSFYRRLPLPEHVDSKNAEANYENGVLKIEVPKLKKVEHKKKILIK